MNTPSLTSIIATVSILALAACTSAGNGEQNSSSSAASLPSSSAMSATPVSIHVTFPHMNEEVQSPLTVTGEAIGPWYFEASFPVRLLDGNGNQIAIAPAQAQSDWMTENLVPFVATLTYTTPATPTGMLILEKDNPSGLPENAAQVSIPVTF